MRGPTCCHMCTEKQHLIVSSLGRPPEKRGARGRGQKHTGSLREATKAPLPNWPALAFAGGNVNLSLAPQKE